MLLIYNDLFAIIKNVKNKEQIQEIFIFNKFPYKPAYDVMNILKLFVMDKNDDSEILISLKKELKRQIKYQKTLYII